MRGKEYSYNYMDDASTTFVDENDIMNIKRLLGLNTDIRSCGGSLNSNSFISLNTSLGDIKWYDFKLNNSNFDKASVRMLFDLYGGKLIYETCWTMSESTGVWSRKDSLRNESGEMVIIHRCLPKFAFIPGNYEIYSQNNNRKLENQGMWQQLHHGGMVFGCEEGVTCQGSTPFLCLREIGKQKGIAFHVVPQGNWRIYAKSIISSSKSSFAVIEAGLSDENLSMELPIGGSIDLPEILIHSILDGEVHLGISNLHRYLNKRMADSIKKDIPIVYNTWCDYWGALDTNRLREQLLAVKELGCEVFVVDAGWYGAGDGDWSFKVGDWREKQNGAFYGRMSEFADEVRTSGLGFGLWVEPERIGSDTPVLKEHPNWFLPLRGNYFYPNLSDENVYQYIFSEMCRLIETYSLVWMKVDFNAELGMDPSNSEYYDYYSKWNKLYDELRQKYPHVFFEGCSGGGMRLDINNLEKYNGYWMTDNSNPLDMLSIYQNLLLRATPGKITKWSVFRSAEKAFPKVSSPTEVLPPSLITWTSTGRPWEGYVTTDLDFSVRVSMPGIFGLSGDIAGLPASVKERLKYHISFYKKWRGLIGRSVAHLSAPPVRIWQYEGWTSIQLQDPEETTSLLFVYRLEDSCNERQFHLKNLQEDRMYTVINEDTPKQVPEQYSGKQLMRSGICVRINNKHNASVIVINPIN